MKPDTAQSIAFHRSRIQAMRWLIPWISAGTYAGAVGGALSAEGNTSDYVVWLFVCLLIVVIMIVSFNVLIRVSNKTMRWIIYLQLLLLFLSAGWFFVFMSYTIEDIQPMLGRTIPTAVQGAIIVTMTGAMLPKLRQATYRVHWWFFSSALSAAVSINAGTSFIGLSQTTEASQVLIGCFLGFMNGLVYTILSGCIPALYWYRD